MLARDYPCMVSRSFPHSEVRVGLSIVRCMLLSSFNQNWNMLTNFSKIPQYHILWKSVSDSQVSPCGQADKVKLICSFLYLHWKCVWKSMNGKADFSIILISFCDVRSIMDLFLQNKQTARHFASRFWNTYGCTFVSTICLLSHVTLGSGDGMSTVLVCFCLLWLFMFLKQNLLKWTYFKSFEDIQNNDRAEKL